MIAGTIAAFLMAFPTGDGQGKNVACHQPVTLAAMEGLFETEDGAPLAISDSPTWKSSRLDNPLDRAQRAQLPHLSALGCRSAGLDAFPQGSLAGQHPAALLQLSHHGGAGHHLHRASWRWPPSPCGAARSTSRAPLLWLLMLMLPFPYIANTAGWITAEVGRQPWLIYGLMRTPAGFSPHVSAGNVLFTLIGFMGMYTVLGDPLPVPGRPRDRRGAGARRQGLRRLRLVMETIWFCLVAVMIATYVVLDGFDLGAGVVHLLVARTDAERRAVLRSIGPVWDGNEVWLLAAGGTLYFAFPALYASSFSGFYLPLMIVLWLLILRGISIEFRNHVESLVWHPLWDAVFAGSSALLAIFFGAALGNVVRGVPLDRAGDFFLPLWTDFTAGPDAGILDWYTVLVAVAALLTLTVHGALWLALKNRGRARTRVPGCSPRSAWWGVLAAVIAITLVSFRVQPHLQPEFRRAPLGLRVSRCLALAGLFGMKIMNAAGRAMEAFLCLLRVHPGHADLGRRRPLSLRAALQHGPGALAHHPEHGGRDTTACKSA